MPGNPLDIANMAQQELGNLGAEATGVFQFFKGMKDKKKDEQELSRLRQPFYKIQNEYFENKNISQELASGGLPPQQKEFLTGQAERGYGSGLDAILKTGGGVNAASMLLDKYNQEIGKIGAEDASQHLANIQYFQKANADLAGQKTMQWSINEYQPYEAKLKELKQNIATDEANKWGGLTTALSSMIGAGTANQNAGLMKKLFSKPTDSGLSTIQDPYAKLPGLAKPGGVAGSPAAGFPSVGSNAPNILNPSNSGDLFPNFDADTWRQMKQDAWDEGSNVQMWSNDNE